MEKIVNVRAGRNIGWALAGVATALLLATALAVSGPAQAARGGGFGGGFHGGGGVLRGKWTAFMAAGSTPGGSLREGCAALRQYPRSFRRGQWRPVGARAVQRRRRLVVG